MRHDGRDRARRVVRAPNHLGDAVMALPALLDARADVMVRSWLVPLFEMAGFPGRVLPLRRGSRGFLDAARRLRRGGYDEGVLMSASFGAALLFRAGGVRHVRGTATDARSLLLADPVPPGELGRRHRVLQYRFLLGQPAQEPASNRARIVPPAAATRAWSRRLDVAGRGAPVALFPGSNAPARRWPAERFMELGCSLAAREWSVVVLGGPGERSLTASVAEGIPGAVDAGGRTDLAGLAAVLALSELLVTNDTGPMHLAGVLGTPTVTVWGSSDPAEVRPLGAAHGPVRLDDALPCMPCRRNRCPRKGVGTRAARAENECLALVSTARVEEAVGRLIAGPRPPGRERGDREPAAGRASWRSVT